LGFESANRLAQKVRPGSIVNPHVVAFSLDTIKVLYIEEEDAAGSFHYQTLDVPRTCFQLLEQSHDVLVASIELLLAEVNPGPLPGSHETFAIEWLEQIVQSVYLKCAHRILVVGSHENDARQMLIQKKSNTLWDQIGRAYGVLTFAHAMTSKEALNLLSIIKLGVDLGAFPEDRRLPIDELFIDTQPAHLQKSSQQKLNAEERDHLRAQIIRERLRVFPKPDISKVARESENGSTSEPQNNE